MGTSPSSVTPDPAHASGLAARGFAAALALAFLLFALPRAWADEPGCREPGPRAIPERSATAATGSQFARTVQQISGPERDAAVLSELLQGNVPGFLRQAVPVRLADAAARHTLILCVLPDYLSVGSDQDHVLVPLGLEAALDVAARFGYELPTPRMVDAIYSAATVKLEPRPLPASNAMRSTDYFVRHNALIEAERAPADARPGALVAGHKKDLVLTRRLWQQPGRVAIYGWHRGEHAPIQPLSTVHGARYADYSHGIRLVSRRVFVDGQPRDLDDVLEDPSLAPLLSSEGPLPGLAQQLAKLMRQLRLDGATAVVDPGSALRRISQELR